MRHCERIDLWPSLSVFADDIGVKYGTAKAMRRRSSIPPEYWLRVITAAASHTIRGVSLDALANGVAIDGPQSERAASLDPDHIAALRLPAQEAVE